MCRLLLLSDTSEALVFRKLVFQHMMVVAAGDEKQADGWGITDGAHCFKGGWTFLDEGARYVPSMADTGILLGHVRKASATTSVTTKEAHPFYFSNKGNPFWLAHNGFVTDTGVSEPGTPNSDSYRVGERLEAMLDGADITQDVLTAWGNTFGAGSEYAFLILQGGVTHVIRGQRALSYIPVGNGYAFATTPLILENLIYFIMFWQKDFKPKIRTLDQYTYVKVTPGTVLEESPWAARNQPYPPNGVMAFLKGSWQQRN